MPYKSLDSITRSDIEALGISDDVSYKLLRDLEDIILNHGSSTPPERWIEISRRILHPDLPFAFHQMMYYGCYKDFGSDPPAWLPDPKVASLTNVGGLLERRGREFLGDDSYKDPISSFSSFQEFSVSNPEVIVYNLWTERNHRIFRQSSSSEAAIISKVDRSIKDRLLSLPPPREGCISFLLLYLTSRSLFPP
ncbi:hypothetical protein DY000_02026257 [Brassica cretica]|uniref:Uncharacterized protein n=1 Tax=Brassica cretica TaxID=69181 RepID=A0ABQ7ED96_BRACR|nr:hypothetical protein DY000_02026257 [Brassica cretica]